MATKLIRSTFTYTAATRIIASATDMTTAFADTDVGHAFVFRLSDATYWGRIARCVSGSSVELHVASTLPGADGTAATYSGFALDQAEAHGYGDYLTRVATLVQDDVSRLTSDEAAILLAAAVTDYGGDRQLTAKFKTTGTGAQTYSAATIWGAYWKHGRTIVKSVEYPSGNIPATMLSDGEFGLYDDGTAQDGSNIVLRFDDYTPLATESFIAEISYDPVLTLVGGQNFPDTDENFNNITLLCAAYYCFALASSYALSTDSTITADAVNYSDKMQKYLALGREFLGRYNTNVFGSKEPTSAAAAATTTLELESRASDRGAFLFH